MKIHRDPDNGSPAAPEKSASRSPRTNSQESYSILQARFDALKAQPDHVDFLGGFLNSTKFRTL